MTEGAYKTLASFKTAVKETLLSEQQEDYIIKTVKKKVMENSTILSYPQEQLQEEIASAKAYFQNLADAAGMDYDSYIEKTTGYSKTEFSDYLTTYAKSILAEEMMLMAVVEKENMTLSDAEYQSYLKEYAAEYQEELTDSSSDGNTEETGNATEAANTSDGADSNTVTDAEEKAAEEKVEKLLGTNNLKSVFLLRKAPDFLAAQAKVTKAADEQ